MYDTEKQKQISIASSLGQEVIRASTYLGIGLPSPGRKLLALSCHFFEELAKLVVTVIHHDEIFRVRFGCFDAGGRCQRGMRT